MTAEGDNSRERTWAHEMACLNINHTNQSDMRVCLVKVSSQPNTHAEVLGHADIKLETFVN